jgi:hypothetical protein
LDNREEHLMQIEQRSVDTDLAPIKKRWIPELNSDPDEEADELEPSDDLSYVVVDDIVEGRVALEVSEWPALDADGRLHFDDVGDERVARLDEFQALVDTRRTESEQYAPRRAIRIGDTFAIFGLSVDEEGSVSAAEVWDISKAARTAAKAAMFGAVASTVDTSYEEEMAISDEVLEVPEKRGVFDVLQEAAKTKPAAAEGEES